MNEILKSVTCFSDAADNLLFEIEKNKICEKETLKQRFHCTLSRFFEENECNQPEPENLEPLTEKSLEIFFDNVKVAKYKMTASRFMQIPIEPMMDLAKIYELAELKTEAEKIMQVHRFALKMRQLYRQFLKI